MRKNKKTGIVIIIAGMIFIMSAVVLLVYNNIQDSGASQAEAMAQTLINRIASEPESAIEPLIKHDLDFNGDEATAMSVMQHDENWYIGIISIPELELSLPVMADWDYQKLKIAPCRYFGNVHENSLVIAAHNYRSHFGNISSLKLGSTVTFTDVNGFVYTYEIKVIETLESSDIREMLQSEYDLTLFTCTYGGAARITVRCDIAEQ